MVSPQSATRKHHLPRLIVGFYGSLEHAEEALHEVRKNHFRRSAAVQRAEDGHLKFLYRGFSPGNRVAAAALIAFALVLAGGILQARPWELVLLGSGGFLTTWFGSLWLGLGLRAQILRNYSRFVLPGESLVVVQEAEKRTTDVIAVLRRIAHPAVFAIRPGLAPSLLGPAETLAESVAMTDLPDCAVQLATSHQLDASTVRSRSLLPILKQCEVAIERARSDLAEAVRLDYGITHAAEWLLDNTYLIRSHVAEIRHNLPDNHNKILPVITNMRSPVRLRIYLIAEDLVCRTGHRVAPDSITSFLHAYQQQAPLTIAELWVFPLMLRLVLLLRLRRLAEMTSLRQHQKELADFWANRLLNAVQRGTEQFDLVVAELDRDGSVLTPHFIARLGEQLHKEESALAPIQKWIEVKMGSPLPEVILREHAEEANDLMLISTAIGSLRQLSELQYPRIVEAVSRMEAILREDPSGVHPRSDFATRDRCRRIVEESARQSKSTEWAVASVAVELARRAAPGSREGCVAFYLLDKGVAELERRVGRRLPWRERLLRFLHRHPAPLYLGAVLALTAGMVGGFLFAVHTLDGASFSTLLLLGILALIPASELALYLVQMLLTWLVPPDTLPKMSFEEGIPDECRTLVVVPMMLLTPDSIRGEIEKLEVRYLANPEHNLYFSLLADFTDAEEPETPEDDELLGLALKGIEQLNARHGNGTFVLFYRSRVWCETELRWIGWERKRGKLEELNRFLNGEIPDHFVCAGAVPPGVRYVITLDADTQLPHGSARRLIETTAHPLNQVELSPDRRNRLRGYTIIQPRVSITLPSATATRFTRLFTDARGSDPYCQAVSDVYQDVFGEGIYHGKAIYDVQAFHKILTRRFPEQRLLSHDLIEGAHVGVGLATDVELFEQFPYDYTSYSKRQHRWIRGDWQIAAWIFPWVPTAGSKHEPNPLTLINRWKIFDNLRRSLLSPCALLLLICSWSLDAAPLAASALVALVLLVPLFVQLLERLAERWRGDVRALHEASSDVNRAVVMAAFLPHQALLALDAIVRACYRLWVSRHHLLEWQTAEMSHLTARAHVDAFRAQFLLISALAAIFLLALDIRGYFWEPAWAPFLLLWVAAPGVRYWIGAQRRAVRKLEEIESDDQHYLRLVARETWRYFDDLVGPEHNWLPPDNTQEALRLETASRTSPTNIGMWLMSALSARDLGFLTPEQMIDRCLSTMETLEKLERCEGHILNWYNTRTLEPLQPRYVSTVDSGNLMASLWVLAEACNELEEQSQLEQRALRGLADTLAVIWDRFPPDRTTAVPMQTLRGLFQEESFGIEIMERIRLSAEPARKLRESLRWTVSEIEERTYWFTRLDEQVQAWITYFDRYLRWADVLLAPPEEFLRPLGEAAVLERRRLLRHLPSWGELSDRDRNLLAEISVDSSGEQKLPPHLIAWMKELRSELEKARAASDALLERSRRLAQVSEDLAASMDMKLLYDADRRLFGIGYQVGAPRTFTAHYDLLASEARLSSLVAIAKGDVPVEHWLSLGRPYTTSNRQVLLSWSGTMFEYLMPLLFTRSFRNSLLENACTAAVRCQQEYARDRGIPWGISESAYSGLDIHRIYQYQAFGVPSLGLKRGLEDDLVVAPYATALALMVDPLESVKNLKRLQRAGMYGRMGFFEALDYTRQQERQGEKGVIVYTYMAHHQGMSLMAIDNALNGGIMRLRFHADRRIRAVEPLLFERIPPQPSMLLHRPSDQVAIRPISEPSAPAYRVLDEDTPIPLGHLLGNGRYALMITNSGAGYSRWRDFDITRWHADSTRDNWGMFFYLRDEETLWSVTHQPLGVKDPAYTAIFTADRAEFRRRRRGVESFVEVTVSPEDDVEVRRITLTNHGLRTRKLELVSAAELSLAPHSVDLAHPAFNKLFIQTEWNADLRALFAWRRPRSENEPPIWTVQFITETPADDGPLDYETDRARFLGRGRSWQNPAMSVQRTDGFVLDPIFALKRRFSLEPRQQRQFAFVTAAAESREELIRLISKYRDPDMCNRTFELAWSHAQLEYRYLDIHGDAAFRFSELASHLLHPNIRLRAPVERLRRNVLGQSRLWAYGISGDLPIAAVSVSDSQGLALAREVLVAHTYWRLRGLKADLVILNREPYSYDEPLHHQLTRLVEAHSLHTGTDRPGGVFLRKANQIPEEDLNLILCVAQATLGSVRGSLSKQLASAAEGAALPPALQVRKAEEQPSPPLPFLELPYFNGLGGFTPDGREYAIYLGPNAYTPLPWINVMSNPVFGAIISESGSGCCWYGNSQSNRLTPWNNDPVSDPAAEAIFIRDEESGVFWTPTPLPVRELDAYRARHGQGYTEFEHNSHALEQALLTFVPMQEDAGDPIRIQRLRIRNTSSRWRRLSVTSYSELVLGTNRESTQMHIAAFWDDSSKALFIRNPYHRDFGRRVAFAAIFPEASSYSSDRTEFLGRNGALQSPAALRRVSLSNRTGVGLDPCGALQTRIEIAPGHEKTVIVLLGQANDAAQARSLINRYRDPNTVEAVLGETKAWWDRLLTTIQVRTPVLSIDLMMNRWLLYQALSCRIWGRSALYQSSGAFGFRDQLQDALAFLYSAPQIARSMILQAATRQFVEGDVQHWWHLPSGEGIRTRCSDDLLWLPYATCHYVDVTGDTGILDVSVAFLEGPRLKEDELESYFQPSSSIEQATLFEHCRRAIEKGTTWGPHGLPLIGTGDWNDSMNSVGDEGRGESIWLAWFLVDVWTKFSGLCERRGEEEMADQYRERARNLSATIERTGWDGEWYRRGFFDDGTPLGSHVNQEARIDSLAQSWSVLSGAGDPARAAQAMAAVSEYLIRAREKLVLLLTPPFDESKPHPGYIMGYPPGVRENGGQYTHAALWVAMAFARLGEGGRAVEILQMLNPVEHAHTPEEYVTYKTEPYVVAADVYSLKSGTGRGGWTWYTGSAGWMYRVWLEEVLGFKLRGDRLLIEPAIPEDWPGFTISFRYGQTEYRIEVQNGGIPSKQEIRLEDDGEKHTIQISTGPRSPRDTDVSSTPSAVV